MDVEEEEKSVDWKVEKGRFYRRGRKLGVENHVRIGKQEREEK